MASPSLYLADDGQQRAAQGGRRGGGMWTRLTGQPEEELLISLWENLAENVIEAGSIFPALGQEGPMAG
jgi:hypothetical protein